MSDNAATIERLGIEAIPSRDRRRTSALHAVEQTAAPAPPPPAASASPPPAEAVYVARRPTAAELILGNLKAISYVLSARALLLLTLVGAFVLGLEAMSWQTPMGLYVLIAWALLTVLPMVGLEVSGRLRRPPGG